MISFVIPVLNEEESLPHFYQELQKEAEKLKTPFEIVFVDDGSSDGTLSYLKNLAKENKHVRLFAFRKNHGKAEALTLGFQMAKGDLIVTLDADLQDKPSEVKKLLDVIDSSYDVVCGWRKDRKDKARTIWSSKIFNSIANRLWGLGLHDYNCGLKVYTSDAAKSLRLYGGMHRFIPLLAYQEGFDVTEVPIEHQQRKYGKSKYGFSKIFKDIPDLFTMVFLGKYAKRPLHFFGIVGTTMFLLGICIFLYLAFIHFAFSAVIGRRPLLLFSMLLIISGLQIFFTGFIAELIISISNRVYHHPPLRYATDTV